MDRRTFLEISTYVGVLPILQEVPPQEIPKRALTWQLDHLTPELDIDKASDSLVTLVMELHLNKFDKFATTSSGTVEDLVHAESDHPRMKAVVKVPRTYHQLTYSFGDVEVHEVLRVDPKKLDTPVSYLLSIKGKPTQTYAFFTFEDGSVKELTGAHHDKTNSKGYVRLKINSDKSLSHIRVPKGNNDMNLNMNTDPKKWDDVYTLALKLIQGFRAKYHALTVK